MNQWHVQDCDRCHKTFGSLTVDTPSIPKCERRNDSVGIEHHRGHQDPAGQPGYDTLLDHMLKAWQKTYQLLGSIRRK